MKISNSDNDPIPLDIIEGSLFGLSGRFGMTYAPGKKGPRMGGGAWDRDLGKDLDRLALLGVDSLVCLVEDFELPMLGIPDLAAETLKRHMRFVHYPIIDVSVPDDIQGFHDFIMGLCWRVETGDTVVLHCRGGRGRTGLVMAACLMYLGMGPYEAIRVTREARAETIETQEQEDFLKHNYHAWLGGQ
jgi:ADP-ribosyl-[dinitrogen reductase] hydrolase